MRVRRFPVVAGLTVVLAASFLAPARAEGVKFLTNPKQALSLAASQKKIVMVDLYTDWCGWCKELDKKVYVKPQIGALAKKNMIALRVNPEKNPIAAGWINKYDVKGFPTVLFINAKEKEIYRIVGFAPAGEFLKEMQKAVAKGRGKT